MLPGPGLRSQRRLEGIEDPARRRFLENYHTTLAGILASFAATVHWPAEITIVDPRSTAEHLGVS